MNMPVAGDLEGCEDLAESVIEANTAMTPLYQKIEGVMDSSKLNCGAPDRNHTALWTELRASTAPLSLGTAVDSCKHARIESCGNSCRITLAEVVNVHVRNIDTIQTIESNPWLSQLDRLTEQYKYPANHSNLWATPVQQDHDDNVESMSGEMQVSDAVPKHYHADSLALSDSASQPRCAFYRIISCTILALGLCVVWVLVAVISSESYFEVINNDERAIQCQSQNYAQLITNWLVQDLINTVGRSRQLLASGSTTVDFSGSTMSGPFAAAIMSMMNTRNPVVGVYGNLFTTWKAQGHAFSVE